MWHSLYVACDIVYMLHVTWDIPDFKSFAQISMCLATLMLTGSGTPYLHNGIIPPDEDDDNAFEVDTRIYIWVKLTKISLLLFPASLNSKVCCLPETWLFKKATVVPREKTKLGFQEPDWNQEVYVAPKREAKQNQEVQISKDRNQTRKPNQLL